MTFEPAINYDEALAGGESLPDPLECSDGTRVETPDQWREKRRPELMRDFERLVYGRTPSVSWTLRTRVKSEQSAFDGLATRRVIEVGFDECPLSFSLLLWVPRGTTEPAPAFVGLNFGGNHTVVPDSDIPLPAPRVGRSASEEARGSGAGQWPVEMFLQSGFALATVCCGELEPDQPDGWREGFRAHLPASNWGACGVWAWGLSRALDVLETQSDVDARRVVVMGHSRLGKSALWAGAQDERFALTVANNPGCGGAAPSRRNFGETLDRITRAFPHWFAPRFASFGGRESELPLDQHSLLALCAPCPLYVASAEEDRWSDPRGEFLGCVAASPVWKLWGKRGLNTLDWPAVGQGVGETLGYHLRPGGHGQTAFDFERFLAFAARHL